MPGLLTCTKGLGALVSVVITGKVSDGNLGGVSKGDRVDLSFLANPKQMVRVIEGQGAVLDGIGPYPVCTEDFALTVSSGHRFYLGAMPVGLDGTPGTVHFSLMHSRPVYDGAWVSTNPADGTEGVPLVLHGDKAAKSNSKHTGIFNLVFERGTIPTTDLKSAAGSSSSGSRYSHKSLVRGKFQVWTYWRGNVSVDVDFDAMTIEHAAHAAT